MSKPPFTLEDRALWNRVAQTTKPMDAKRGEKLRAEMAQLMGEVATARGDAPLQIKPRYKPPAAQAHGSPPRTTQRVPAGAGARAQSHPIEDPVYRKLGKGRLSVDSRIDLHGMTQDRARFALLDFLQMAQRAGDRIVLVITGKGNDGTGVLRRNVPHWLELPAYRGLVNGTRPAHASHGGDGALYVRLRKAR